MSEFSKVCQPAIRLGLLVHAAAGQVVFAANVCVFLVVDSLQLWTVGDSVTKTTTVRATNVVSGSEELVLVGLEGGKERRHLLIGLHQQVFQIEENCRPTRVCSLISSFE